MKKDRVTLHEHLLRDINTLGLGGKYILILRFKYDKTRFGTFDPRTDTICLYCHKNDQGEPYSYDELLNTLIHEAIHYKQWHSANFVRIKGIMHNPEFKRMYSVYSFKAKELLESREKVR